MPPYVPRHLLVWERVESQPLGQIFRGVVGVDCLEHSLRHLGRPSVAVYVEITVQEWGINKARGGAHTVASKRCCAVLDWGGRQVGFGPAWQLRRVAHEVHTGRQSLGHCVLERAQDGSLLDGTALPVVVKLVECRS